MTSRRGDWSLRLQPDTSHEGSSSVYTSSHVSHLHRGPKLTWDLCTRIRDWLDRTFSATSDEDDARLGSWIRIGQEDGRLGESPSSFLWDCQVMKDGGSFLASWNSGTDGDDDSAPIGPANTP